MNGWLPPSTLPWQRSTAVRAFEGDPTSEFLDQLGLRCEVAGELTIAADQTASVCLPERGFLLPVTGSIQLISGGQPRMELHAGELFLSLVPHQPVLSPTPAMPIDPDVTAASAGTSSGWLTITTPRPSRALGLPTEETAPAFRSARRDVVRSSFEIGVLTGSISPRAGDPTWLKELVPATLTAPADDSPASLSRQALSQVCELVTADLPGGLALINQLITVVCLDSIRQAVVAASHVEPGWILALQDTEIGAVLSAMLREPAYPWTTRALANHANLARSTFSRRFMQLMGHAPMHTLYNIRMRQASDLLQSNLPLKEIAKRGGYRSISAFTAAFHRWGGTTPKAFRTAAAADRQQFQAATQQQ